MYLTVTVALSNQTEFLRRSLYQYLVFIQKVCSLLIKRIQIVCQLMCLIWILLFPKVILKGYMINGKMFLFKLYSLPQLIVLLLVDGKIIQVLHVRNCHWVLLTSHMVTPTTVRVYDSNVSKSRGSGPMSTICPELNVSQNSVFNFLFKTFQIFIFLIET